MAVKLTLSFPCASIHFLPHAMELYTGQKSNFKFPIQLMSAVPKDTKDVKGALLGARASYPKENLELDKS